MQLRMEPQETLQALDAAPGLATTLPRIKLVSA